MIVDEEILDVSDVAIRRVDMMSDDGAAAAQVAPILRSDRQRSESPATTGGCSLVHMSRAEATTCMVVEREERRAARRSDWRDD